MIEIILDLMNEVRRVRYATKLVFITIFIFYPLNSFSQEARFSFDSSLNKSLTSKVIYRNPQVMTVDYTFELVPDHAKIDKGKDLKVWIPVPREWDSQKAVKILAIEPVPHYTYEDPEHGNKILFWDFGKESVKDSYQVNIKYRLEIFEVHCIIDPEQIGLYDKNSENYQLYTRSTNKINITSELKELAQIAVDNEKNAYLQAKRIFEFVRNRIRYKTVRRERGTGIESILDFPVSDPITGEQYYEGQCDHYSTFFIGLCRAVGIPARGVTGMVGWDPSIKEKDLKPHTTRHTKLTADGLAATRTYGSMVGHIWAEFYLPEYGWIPVDPTWGKFGHQGNKKIILSKGFDVKIGPYAPQDESEGYGDQWIPLYKGRAAIIGWGVWNIAKIGIAKAKILQNSDPFPADSYAEYAAQLYPENEEEEKLRNWRQKVLLSFYNAKRGDINNGELFEINPRLNENREAYLCHLLRQIIGDEKFLKIFRSYLDLRLTSGKSVSIEKFQDIAERMHGTSLDFFFKQWLGNIALPQFKLDNILIEKVLNQWKVYGSLLQKGETTYQVPVELVLETEKGQESKEIWLDSKKTDFEFYTTDQPKKLIVDPDFHIPTIRWMPTRIRTFWDFYPDGIIVYGTSSEGEDNKAAAILFDDKWLGLGQESIKADTTITKEDLNKHFVVLIGRPKTNKIALQLKNAFPILFDKDKFLYQDIIYNKPSQGIVLITESTVNPNGWIILLAGLSNNATLKMSNLSPYDPAASYIIFEDKNVLRSGYWEEDNSDLVWNFK